MSKASIRALRDALAQKSAALKAQASSALQTEVEGLAAAMRAKVRIKTGTLAETIEAVKIGENAYRVQAGGVKTTKEVRTGSGVPYDYARSEEFGTRKEEAKPFFFNTYRSKKSGLKSRIKKAAANSQI